MTKQSTLPLRDYGLLRFARNDGERPVVFLYPSRISSSRRPSPFSSFFTALEAITSPLLA